MRSSSGTASVRCRSASLSGPADLLLGDALVFAGLLGELELQLLLGFDEPGALFEQGALMNKGLALAVFGDELLDLALALFVGDRVVEGSLNASRDQ